MIDMIQCSDSEKTLKVKYTGDEIHVKGSFIIKSVNFEVKKHGKTTN